PFTSLGCVSGERRRTRSDVRWDSAAPPVRVTIRQLPAGLRVLAGAGHIAADLVAGVAANERDGERRDDAGLRVADIPAADGDDLHLGRDPSTLKPPGRGGDVVGDGARRA